MTTTPVQEPKVDKGTFTHELTVIQRVYDMLGELERSAQHRVLEYVIKRQEADNRAEAEKEKLAAHDKMAMEEKKLGELRRASALRQENATRY